ncbi:MAG: RHS repeat-associated core domain-containing protein [Chthoniobacterales bacterium]
MDIPGDVAAGTDVRIRLDVILPHDDGGGSYNLACQMRAASTFGAVMAWNVNVSCPRGLAPTVPPLDARRTDAFIYDALGNRKQSNHVASRGDVTFARRDNGLNQYLTWVSGVAYNSNGAMTSEGSINGTFNALNQPVSISSAGNYFRFGYDPLGRCVKRWVGSSGAANANPASYFYYDGWSLIQEGPSATTVARTYVHGARVDEVVADSAGGGTWNYHHYDARGHCILLTGSSGTLLEQYEYDAFGQPYVFNGAGVPQPGGTNFGNRFLFTGREYMRALGLYDFRNRLYQPELGRFLQPDPKQFGAGDYNLYRYCHNDPVNRSDPDGLSGTPIAADYLWERAKLFDSGNNSQGTLTDLWAREGSQAHDVDGGRDITFARQTRIERNGGDRVRHGDGYGSSAIEAGLMREGDAKKIAHGVTEGVAEIGQSEINPNQFYATPARGGNPGSSNYKDSVKKNDGYVATSVINSANLPPHYKLVGGVLAHRYFTSSRAGEDIQRAKNNHWQTFIITSPQLRSPVIYDKDTHPNPSY